ncbi:hypothetical protein G6F57_020872 [Rhizopus arrhizus]|nr:hypothetical protein G6F57_020872 [Rhizopus arrhizus]
MLKPLNSAQADTGGGVPALRVVQVHADGIALDRIDVQRVAHLSRELAADGAGADDDGIGFVLLALGAAFAQDVQHIGTAVAADLLDVGVLHERDAMAFARARQAAREFVDVAGGVRRRVEAAVAIRLQRGFDIAGFAAGYRVPLQAACL